MHFLDDDVACEPAYLEGIVGEFEKDRDGRVLGVGGLITNE